MSRDTKKQVTRNFDDEHQPAKCAEHPPCPFLTTNQECLSRQSGCLHMRFTPANDIVNIRCGWKQYINKIAETKERK